MGGKKVDVADLLAFDQLQRRVTMALEGGVSQAEVKQLLRGPGDLRQVPRRHREGRRPGAADDRVGQIVASPQLWEATKGMTAEETMQPLSSRSCSASTADHRQLRRRIRTP